MDKFEQRLQYQVLCEERKVRKKHKRDGKDNSLPKQFLLVVTCEPSLDEKTLSEYLETIILQRPRYFDGFFVMGSYVPDGEGYGHYPILKPPWQDRKMRV